MYIGFDMKHQSSISGVSLAIFASYGMWGKLWLRSVRAEGNFLSIDISELKGFAKSIEVYQTSIEIYPIIAQWIRYLHVETH